MATSAVSTKMTPNGPGAAAVLAAGMGCFTLGVISVVADKVPALARGLIFVRATGPLSGVSTVSILVWLGVWGYLQHRWQQRIVDLRWTNGIAFVLLACGLLLTFPPIGDLL
jgi:hypothetical protein